MKRAILAATLAALGAPPAAAWAQPETWRIDAARSRLVVHVLKKGALAAALHDHHFRPQRWRGTIVVDREHPETPHVEVVVDAASLRDDQPALSPSDRAQVEEQARGPAILDVSRHPEIRFAADRLEVTERTADGDGTRGAGVLVGALTLRGATRPLRIAVRGGVSADAMTVSGDVSFVQRDFGIEPVSRLLGAIAVEDRVTVEIAVEAVRSEEVGGR